MAHIFYWEENKLLLNSRQTTSETILTTTFLLMLDEAARNINNMEGTAANIEVHAMERVSHLAAMKGRKTITEEGTTAT